MRTARRALYHIPVNSYLKFFNLNFYWKGIITTSAYEMEFSK